MMYITDFNKNHFTKTNSNSPGIMTEYIVKKPNIRAENKARKIFVHLSV